MRDVKRSTLTYVEQSQEDRKQGWKQLQKAMDSKMSARELAAASLEAGLGAFHEKEEFYLYLSETSRLKVSLEVHNEPAVRFERMKLLEAEGGGALVDERDAAQLAEDFVDMFAGHLTTRQVQHLLAALAKELL